MEERRISIVVFGDGHCRKHAVMRKIGHKEEGHHDGIGASLVHRMATYMQSTVILKIMEAATPRIS